MIFLQVDPSYWRIKVSGVVPRLREHGWQWELCEMSNSKCWRALVHMATNKIKFPLVVLVQQELANETQGESSHAVAATEMVAETEWPFENSVAEDQQSQPEVNQQAKHQTKAGNWEFGAHMIADQGELDETIVDEMDLDDEEYKTFVEGRDGHLFENEDTIHQDWGNGDHKWLIVS